ncbi:MAG: hypothetical protein JSS27_10745 [Planctomycetes bacterium]|nr:hypothetical protein [Planctomycetota bacterium]
MNTTSVSSWIAWAINWAILIGVPAALLLMIFYFWRDLSKFLFSAMRYLPRLPGLPGSSGPKVEREQDFYDASWVSAGAGVDFDARLREAQAAQSHDAPAAEPDGPFKARRRDSSIIYEVVPLPDGYLVRPIARKAGKETYRVSKKDFWASFEKL